MSYDYESLYATTPDALGAPTQMFVDFFADLPKGALRVLDVGCGQGRDALFIARAGHHVVGVDLSASGIRDLTQTAKDEGLDILGVVADITAFTPDGTFDVVLIDRTLHMLDAPDRHAVLGRLLDHVATGGWCLIADEASNIAGLATVADQHPTHWITTKRHKGYLFLQAAAVA